MERTARVLRETKETRIELELALDGGGQYRIETGVGFFDHMLCHVARHGLFDLTLTVDGDLEVDAHHTVEDTGLALGQAVREAVGDKKGIVRFGSARVPMDDALAEVTVDLSGRAACVVHVPFVADRIGDFDVELVSEYLRAFSSSAAINLHVTVPYGGNNHHMAEAIFKGLGLALRQAVAIDPRQAEVPSTKGVL